MKSWGELLDRALVDPKKRKDYDYRYFRPGPKKFPYLLPNYRRILFDEGKRIGIGSGGMSAKQAVGTLEMDEAYFRPFTSVATITSGEKYREKIRERDESGKAEIKKVFHLFEMIAALPLRKAYAEAKGRFRFQRKARLLTPQQREEVSRKNLIFLKNVRARIVELTSKAVALEDFLEKHPASISDIEKSRIVDEVKTPWDLPTHRTVKGILQAEAELKDIFEEFSATEQEKAEQTAEFASRTNFLRARDAVRSYFVRTRGLRRKKAQEDPIVTQTPQGAGKSLAAAASYEQSPNQPAKTPEMKKILHLIRSLEDQGHLSHAETLHLISQYPGEDKLAFAERLVKEYEKRQLESQGKKVRPKEEPALPPEETPQQLLKRIKQARLVSTTDITKLRKRLTTHTLSQEEEDEALEHVILHRLANEGKTYRIKIDTISKVVPRALQGKSRIVVRRLMREGKLSERRDHPGYAIISDAGLRQRYNG